MTRRFHFNKNEAPFFPVIIFAGFFLCHFRGEEVVVSPKDVMPVCLEF